MTNTLAYYDMATITAVKCFRVEGISKFFSLKLSDSNFILRNNTEVDLFEETRYPQLGTALFVQTLMTLMTFSKKSLSIITFSIKTFRPITFSPTS